MSTTVSSAHRYAKDHPCPICGGHPRLPQGQGVRCYGFLGSDGRYAHCTREDHAGALDPEPGSGTYAHRLDRSCRCGQAHGEPAFTAPEANPASASPPRGVRTRRWEHGRIDGEAIEHVREDLSSGEKRVWWERGGSKGLRGLRIADLPLYKSASLNGAQDVILAEGEPATDAGDGLGIPVVGTVTGAKSAPSDESLRLLLGKSVYLWPDNDDDGERHMAKIAERLFTLGQSPEKIRRVFWNEAPRKGDLADWRAAGGTAEALRLLLRSAPPWESIPPNPEKDQEVYGGKPDPPPSSRIITAGELSGKTFPDPKWAVAGVVPDGATVLVGAPKKGKSWLLLGLGIAIAAGGRALGKVAVETGDVLLLCLEDNQRRLQERLWRVLDGEPAPERLHLVTEWPRLDEGADAALDAWLTAHPTTRLVGIDVLARLRPPSNGNGNLYQLDYWTLASLKAVADKHSVALVVVHHSRKATADDPLDTISGTAGLAGAADTALILTREKSRADGNLYVRGRDVPEADYALGFDPLTCTWNLLGDAAEFRLTAGRAEVIALLRTRGLLSPKEIAQALGAEPGNVRVLLHRMKNAGEVLSNDGLYSVPPSPHVTGVTPPENDATVRNSRVTPPVTSSEGVTPLVTPKTCGTARVSDPVTPVTPESAGGSIGAETIGYLTPPKHRPATVRVPVA